MIPERDHPIAVAYRDDNLQVTLANQRQITVSLTTYPTLLHATPEQRANVQCTLAGLYWSDLNLDISLLLLLGDSTLPTRRHKPRFCEG